MTMKKDAKKNNRTTGGQAGMRGYLVQTLIALLDGLCDEETFASLTLEPNHASEKFDLLWEYAQGNRAVQVKSSANQFAEADVRRWAAEMEASARADEYYLRLIGLPSAAVAKLKQVGNVIVETTNLDLAAFREQAAHRLDRFVRDEGLDPGTPEEREMLADALTARLAAYSAMGKPLTRADFVNLLRTWISQVPKKGPRIAPTRLRHGAETLVGRQKELKRLDKAWAGSKKKVNVVTIVAWGGVGKTALVVDWMARMARDGWRGAERVFDWSFYSQGTSETNTASADVFVAKALEFFGDPETAKSPASPWDKGERLARLVAERRTLLVLDGVEPLQHPPGLVGGRLKDPAVEALLKGLAQHNAGLCIVTTRESIADLNPFHHTTAPEWPLGHLSEEAGAQLLFDAGVKRAGNAEIKPGDQELKDATREVGGHALTLQLLGRYLAKAHNGDVRKRSLVAFKKADAKVQGGHAFRMMAAYEKWLDRGGEEGKRQLAVLHLLGLFDRPADAGCVAALREEPPIEGLTDSLVALGDDDWNYTLSNLRECALIATHGDDLSLVSRLLLDAHPLVREYFARRLQERNVQAWRAAHRRLYEYLKESNPGQPSTFEGLQPLYQAVAHGCLAAEYQDALDDVYENRIQRGVEHFARNRFGSFPSDFAALANFLQPQTFEPVHDLTNRGKSEVLIHAGFYLRVLGRIKEAKRVCQRGVQFNKEIGDSEFAARAAVNLAEANLSSGDVASAVALARESVALADESGDPFLRMYTRTSLGDALHQAGQLNESKAVFLEAEQRQAERQPTLPLLHSGYGFLYCDLLFDCDELEEVTRRAHETIQWARERKHRRWIALDELSLGRVAFLRAAGKASRNLRTVNVHYDSAVPDLLIYGQQQEKPHALLARAQLRFLQSDARGARGDLDEAWQIAERGSMRLHMADVLLHRARLFRDKAALTEARKLIDECEYHRRDGELADAEEAARGW